MHSKALYNRISIESTISHLSTFNQHTVHLIERKDEKHKHLSGYSLHTHQLLIQARYSNLWSIDIAHSAPFSFASLFFSFLSSQKTWQKKTTNVNLVTCLHKAYFLFWSISRTPHRDWPSALLSKRCTAKRPTIISPQNALYIYSLHSIDTLWVDSGSNEKREYLSGYSLYALHVLIQE